MKLAFHRGIQAGILSRSSGIRGAMIAVGLSEKKLVLYLDRLVNEPGKPDLSIACFNSSNSLTVAGDEEQVNALQTVLEEAKEYHQKLKVNVAYHSPHMRFIASNYQSDIQILESGNHAHLPATIMVSTVTGNVVSKDDLLSSQYWVENLVSPVRFCDALSLVGSTPVKATRATIDLSHRRTLYVDALIEVGPHSALKGPIYDNLRACDAHESIKYRSMITRGSPAVRTALEAVGLLHCLGYKVHLAQIDSHCSTIETQTVLGDLPEYPFDQSQSYWYESRVSKRVRLGGYPKHPILGKPVADWNPLDARWRNFLTLTDMPWLRDHKVCRLE